MRTLILGIVAGVVVAFGLLFLEGLAVLLQGTMYASSTFVAPDHPPINFFHPVFMAGIACGAIAWWLTFKRKTKSFASATLAFLLMTAFTCSTILPFLRNYEFTHEHYEQYNKNMSEMYEQSEEYRLLKLKSEQSKRLQSKPLQSKQLQSEPLQSKKLQSKPLQSKQLQSEPLQK